jgi:hypothetical protein
MTIPLRAAPVAATVAGAPPAPWRLVGPCVVVPALVPIQSAIGAAPDGVRVLALAPGWSIGGLLLATYGGPSTLSYSELIAFAGVGLRGRRAGLLVGAIVVDSEPSITGGRSIWQLPKEGARFDGDLVAGHMEVTDEEGRVLLRLRAGPPRGRVPIPTAATFLGVLDGGRSMSAVGGVLRGGPARVRVDVPAESALAPLGLRLWPLGLAGEADVAVRAPRHQRT